MKMTNGEKIKQIFPNRDLHSKQTEGDWWEEAHLGKVCYEIDYQSIYFDEDWWNEEYKEPNIKIVADVIQHGKIGETPVCITCQHRQTCGTYWNDGLGMNPLMPSIRICRNYVKDESEVDT